MVNILRITRVSITISRVERCQPVNILSVYELPGGFESFGGPPSPANSVETW